MRRSAAVLAALPVLAFAAGCSSDPKTINRVAVQNQAQRDLDAATRAAGQGRYPKITCPKDLDAKKGATLRCSAQGPNGPLKVTATVLSVNGDRTEIRTHGDNARN